MNRHYAGMSMQMLSTCEINSIRNRELQWT